MGLSRDQQSEVAGRTAQQYAAKLFPLEEDFKGTQWSPYSQKILLLINRYRRLPYRKLPLLK